MSLQDHEQMQNFRNGGPQTMNIEEYADKQTCEVDDINNGSYKDIIKFDLGKQVDKTILSPDCIRLQAPITVKSAGTAYTGPLAGMLINGAVAADGGTDLLAFRPSIYSTIRKIELKFPGNATVNDGDEVHYINNLRLGIEKNSNWLQNNSDEIYFDMDTQPPNADNSSYLPLIYQGITALPYIVYESDNGNTGLLNRVKAFFSDFTFDTDTYSGTLNIELSQVSDLIRRMNEPTINFKPQIWVYLNFESGKTTAGNDYPPIQALTVNNVPAKAAAPGNFAHLIAEDAAAPIITINGPCKLFYDAITPDSKFGKEFLDRLGMGYTRVIKYVVTEIDSSQVNKNLANTTTYSPFEGTIDPVRLWVLAYPTGNINDTGLPGIYNLTTKLTNLNLKINGTYFFTGGELDDDYRIYDQLQQNMPGYGVSDTNGGILDYLTWKNVSRFVLLDFHRAKHTLSAPGSKNNLEFKFLNSPDHAACDYVYVLERMETIYLEYTAAGVRYVKK